MDSYVTARLEGIPGKLGFLCKNLATGQSFGLRENEPFLAASVIKLPILAAILLRASEAPGNLLEETVLVTDAEKVPSCGALQHITGENCYDIRTLCKLMITLSDNTATNALIRHFGMEALNSDFRRLGLEGTHIERCLFDSEAGALGRENYFIPREIASLLQRAYRGELVSPKASQFLTELLTLQQIKHKIQGRLPKTIAVAHKTGEDSGITHDVGIIYAQEPLVVVFASNETDVPAFEQAIRDISYHLAVEMQ